MDIITNLVKLADSLDKSHLSHMADDVDSISKKVFKVAKYFGDGIQGHWIRNERCWQNCYRSKRKSSPDKSAQEVWMDCQEEYQKSIGKETSEWDKYAGEPSSLKTARSDKLNQKFASVVDDMVNAGEDRGQAIFSILNEQIYDPADSALECAEEMIHLANRLSIIDGSLAKQASDISAEITKMAQRGFFGKTWDLLSGKTNPESITNRVNKIINEIEGIVSMIPSDPKQLAAGASDNAKRLSNLLDKLEPKVNALGSLAARNKDMNVKTLVTNLTNGFNKMKAMDNEEKAKARAAHPGLVEDKNFKDPQVASQYLQNKLPMLKQLLQQGKAVAQADTASTTNLPTPGATTPGATTPGATTPGATQPATNTGNYKIDEKGNKVPNLDPIPLAGSNAPAGTFETYSPSVGNVQLRQPKTKATKMTGNYVYDSSKAQPAMIPTDMMGNSAPKLQGNNSLQGGGMWTPKINQPTAPQSFMPSAEGSGPNLFPFAAQPAAPAGGIGTSTFNQIPAQNNPNSGQLGLGTSPSIQPQTIQPNTMKSLSPKKKNPQWGGQPSGLSQLAPSQFQAAASINSKGIKEASIEYKESITKEGSGLVSLYKI